MATQPESNTPAACQDPQIPEAAQKLGEQFLAAVGHSQDVALDAARASVQAASSSLKDVPGGAALPDVEALTACGLDLAAELLRAQKELTLQLAATLASASPAKAYSVSQPSRESRERLPEGARDDDVDLLGSFTRAQRPMANLSLRQLSAMTEVSNPSRSQIKRGSSDPSGY